jgi:methanogenic corrinoid protein MtbC1
MADNKKLAQQIIIKNKEISNSFEKNDKFFEELLISQEEHGNTKEFLEKYNEFRKEERELLKKMKNMRKEMILILDTSSK